MAVVLTDIQIAFAAGALFADAGAPVIEAARRESEAALAKLYSSYMLRSLVYCRRISGPVATISLLAYPAWETQYLSGIFDNTVAYNDTAHFPINAYPYGIFLGGRFHWRVVRQLARLQVGAQWCAQEIARAVSGNRRDHLRNRLAALSRANSGVRLRALQSRSVCAAVSELHREQTFFL